MLFSSSWIWGVVVAAGVFGTLIWAIRNSFASQSGIGPKTDAGVKQIGDALMTRFVLPFEVVGLLLTAALIGAVIIAMREEKK
jgi:NADH-quinone oxidoreductase subunit J